MHWECCVCLLYTISVSDIKRCKQYVVIILYISMTCAQNTIIALPEQFWMEFYPLTGKQDMGNVSG